MRTIIAGLLALATCVIATWAVVAACRESSTTVLLVRHADREPGEDRLSAAGLARALTLARLLLRDARISAIYQTQYGRTQETAAPVAAGFGLTPIEVDARDSEAVARDIREHRAGETVLVVGHSNTVPDVVAALGGPSIEDFAEDDYDRLLVLDLCGCSIGKQARLTQLRY